MNASWQSTTEIASGDPETSPYTASGDRPMKNLRSTSDCVVPSRPWFPSPSGRMLFEGHADLLAGTGGSRR